MLFITVSLLLKTAFFPPQYDVFNHFNPFYADDVQMSLFK